jgi:hypothetical protein
MDMRFGTRNVRSLAKELENPKLDLEGVQEARWDRGGTEPAGDYKFFYRNGNGNHELRPGFFGHKKIISSDRLVKTAL